MLSYSVMFNSATTWSIACLAPLSMGFSRQECWNGLPFPSPGDVPNPGVKHTSPALAGGFFSTEPLGKALHFAVYKYQITVLYTLN